MTKQDQVIAFRCDEALRDRIRRHVERLKAALPGHGFKVAEADAVRDLVLRALAQVEGAKKRKSAGQANR